MLPILQGDRWPHSRNICAKRRVLMMVNLPRNQYDRKSAVRKRVWEWWGEVTTICSTKTKYGVISSSRQTQKDKVQVNLLRILPSQTRYLEGIRLMWLSGELDETSYACWNSHHSKISAAILGRFVFQTSSHISLNFDFMIPGGNWYDSIGVGQRNTLYTFNSWSIWFFCRQTTLLRIFRQ